jgi:voltage-gated potassium channel
LRSVRKAKAIQNLGKQQYLFAALLLFLLVGPLSDPVERPVAQFLMYCAMAAVFVTGPLAVVRGRSAFYFTLALAVCTILIGFSSIVLAQMHPFAVALGLVFFVFLTALVLRELLFHTEAVVGETLWMAVNAYLLIGLVFAFIYAGIALFVPDAFVGKFMEQPLREQMYGFIYFSFVTLSTLGYGDLTPNSTFVGTLAYLQALFGQLYLTILLARLVALYMVRKS